MDNSFEMTCGENSMGAEPPSQLFRCEPLPNTRKFADLTIYVVCV